MAEKSVLLFGGRICEELYKSMLFPKQDYNVLRIETMLDYASFPKGISKIDREYENCNLVVIDLQSVVEELILKKISWEISSEWLGNLGAEMKQKFSEENIVLLHVFRPPYYVIGNRIRVQSSKPYEELINDVEQVFLEQCKCHVISLHNCYFSLKPYGETLSLYRYENEYYQEVVHRIDTYLQKQKNIFDLGICFAYAVNRFQRYFWTLEKKAFLLFLNQDRMLEDLVLCSTPEFLKQYRESILYLADHAGTDADIKEYHSLIMEQASDCSCEFADIMKAFDAVHKKEYDKNDVNYSLLFLNGMRMQALLDELRSWGKSNRKELGLKHQKQITFYNYGAYFTWKQTGSKLDFAKAIETFNNLQGEEICEKPVVVDIWGSCVSRVNLNFDDERTLVTSIYNFQVPPFAETEPIKYDKEIISECQSWYDNIVRSQLDGTTIQNLENSPADWILVDFFSLSSQRVFLYNGRYFTDYYGKIAELLGAENSSIWDIPMEEICDKIRIFAKTLKKRYGSHIILIQTKRQESYLTQERQIRDFAKKEINKEINKKIDELSKYFAYLTQCYYINIVDDFYADEIGFMKLSDVHYENEYYEKTVRIIYKIIKQEPENHWFCSYFQDADKKRIENNKLGLLHIFYYSSKNCTWSYTSQNGTVHLNLDGSAVYVPKMKIMNNGTAKFEANRFSLPGYQFKGYYLRVWSGKHWLWYAEDGMWVKDRLKKCRLFLPNEEIPEICGIEFEKAEAYCVWENTYFLNKFYIYFFTASSKGTISWNYDESDGCVVKNPSGSYEYRCKNQKICNDGTYKLRRNCFRRKGYEFLGWKLRIKCDGSWYWYMKDCSLQKYDPKITQEEFSNNKELFSDGAVLPVLPLDGIELIVAEAVWKKKSKFFH